MTRLFAYLTLVSFVCGCQSLNESLTEDIITHASLSLRYELVSMDGYELSLERDKSVMGAENIKSTTLTAYNYWNGEIEWKHLSFGEGCLILRNSPDGVVEMPDWCTELVTIDGRLNEYLPYVAARKNFVESIFPEIHTERSTDVGDIEWLDSNGVRIAHFKFLEAAE